MNNMQNEPITLDRVFDMGSMELVMVLQMRWNPELEIVRYVGREGRFMIFQSPRFEEDRIKIEVDYTEYGFVWRCFDGYPFDDGAAPWSDGQGSWTFEEDPEG